jgi:hypothetical protein
VDDKELRTCRSSWNLDKYEFLVMKFPLFQVLHY